LCIVPITQYRKKTYGTDFAQKTITKLNAKLRLTT
jgi:branched-chain amino acid aminotransferase